MITETQIGEAWAMFSEYISKANIDAAAAHYIELLVSFGVSDVALHSLEGVDPALNLAIAYYFADDSDDDDEDYDSSELDF